jgi:hypothetical protein
MERLMGIQAGQALLAMLAATLVACGGGGRELLPPLDEGRLVVGTWGGDSAGMIVGDSTVHVHVGCTSGNVPGRIVVDASHRFDVAGSYHLRMHPIVIGPAMPARYTGQLTGETVALTITVTDTVDKKTVVLGPVSVTLGRAPRQMPCPICRDAKDRTMR